MEFNISYSAYSTYLENQLLFYYKYIVKAPADTKVPQIYGDIGQVLHSCMEHYLRDRKIDIFSTFEKYWSEKIKEPCNKKAETMQLVLNCVEYVAKTFNKDYKIETEKLLQFKEEEYGGFNIKGLIDVFAFKGEDLYLFDWKTASLSLNEIDSETTNYEKEKLQRLFYSWLCWKTIGKIPKKCTWFYVKIAKEYSDSFTLDDLKKFDLEIKKFIQELKTKGDDINQYEIGDVDGFFNDHKIKCLNEKTKREKKANSTIVAVIKNNSITCSYLPEMVKKYLAERFSYNVKGAEFSEMYQSKRWDGKKHMFSIAKLKFPLAYIHEFEFVIQQYNEHYADKVSIEYKDMRNRKVIDYVYDTKYKPIPDDYLRYYQKEAVEVALQKKFGILFLGTGAGKSIIGAELIKRINKRTLFLVNRVELIRQTKEEFEKYLGVPIGEMQEGKLNIDYQITIGSIQTIYSILKRNDETTKKLKLYLFNTPVVISDEAQNVTDEGMYGAVLDNMNNLEYSIGLSGSPWRNV